MNIWMGVECQWSGQSKVRQLGLQGPRWEPGWDKLDYKTLLACDLRTFCIFWQSNMKSHVKSSEASISPKVSFVKVVPTEILVGHWWDNFHTFSNFLQFYWANGKYVNFCLFCVLSCTTFDKYPTFQCLLGIFLLWNVSF